MDTPIFLIGPHRSGTTWVGEALSSAREIAYWVEPREVWQYRNWFRPDDVLNAEDATPAVKSYIRWRFDRYRRQKGGRRFCEKTPSNCVRLPFIHEVFPTAQYVFLIRDGRAVFRSTSKRLSDGIDLYPIWRRLTESFVWEYPAHLSRLTWLGRRMVGKPLNYWGVRPKGWRDWGRDESQNVVVAKQWVAAIEQARADLARLPAEQVHTIRYEEIVSQPKEVGEALIQFLQLDHGDAVVDYLKRTATGDPMTKWEREVDPDVLDEIQPHLETTLRTFGYQWQ